MSLIAVGYIAVVAMLTLILLGVPIAWSMAIVGVLGELYVTGFTAAASKLSLTLWENGTLFVFIALPLFLLMGQLAYRTGITDDLYDVRIKKADDSYSAGSDALMTKFDLRIGYIKRNGISPTTKTRY